jgi:hypothetical protein
MNHLPCGGLADPGGENISKDQFANVFGWAVATLERCLYAGCRKFRSRVLCEIAKKLPDRGPFSSKNPRCLDVFSHRNFSLAVYRTQELRVG